jgi:hypothetical protein
MYERRIAGLEDKLQSERSIHMAKEVTIQKRLDESRRGTHPGAVPLSPLSL